MTNRTIIASLLTTLAACKGEGRKPAPQAAADPQAPSAPALADADNAWSILVEVGSASIDPVDTWMVARDLRSGAEPDPAKLAAARQTLVTHARPLQLVERGVARGRCQIPEVGPGEVAPAAMSAYQLSRLRTFRATLAASEGDLEDAASDLAGVVDLADLLARCGGGLLVVSLAQAIETDAVETGVWLADKTLSHSSRRRLLDALAVEPGDPMAIALAAEAGVVSRASRELAAQGRDGLVDLMVTSAHLIRLQGATLGLLQAAARLEPGFDHAASEVKQQVDRFGEVDGRVRAQLAGLLARHPMPLDPDATGALVAAGLQRITRAHLRGEPEVTTDREVTVIFSGLGAELGPAMRLLTDPDSVADGIPPDIERAFLRAKNPLGRLQAGLALDGMSSAVASYRERASRLAADRARLTALLAAQGGAAK